MIDIIKSTMPLEINQGDSITWIQSFRDYPTEQFTLSYHIASKSGSKNINSSSVNSEFFVNIPSFISNTYTPSIYKIFGIFTNINTGDRNTIDFGTIKVNQDILTLLNTDFTTVNRKTLNAIIATLERRATYDQQSYMIEGKQVSRMAIKDLTYFKEYYENLVRREEEAEARKNGTKVAKKNKLYVAFNEVNKYH